MAPAPAAPGPRGLRCRVPSPPQTPLRFFLLLASAAKIMHFLESGRVHFSCLKMHPKFRSSLSDVTSGAAEPGLAPCPGEPGVGSSKTRGKSTPAFELLHSAKGQSYLRLALTAQSHCVSPESEIIQYFSIMLKWISELCLASCPANK